MKMAIIKNNSKNFSFRHEKGKKDELRENNIIILSLDTPGIELTETKKKSLVWRDNKSLMSLKGSSSYQHTRLTGSCQSLYHSKLMWNEDRMTVDDRNIISEVVYTKTPINDNNG